MPRIPVSCLALFLAAGLAGKALAQPETFTTEELIAGFNSTVFGLEYRTWSWQPYLVKKFAKPVRFRIINLSQQDRRAEVEAFIAEMDSRIEGLSAALAGPGEEPNFDIYIVDRHQYEDVVRQSVYKDMTADAPGRCLVRVESGRKGIKSSRAVIVSDEGDFLFRRCLVEELLQGLGPMNDDEKLVHSVFNDSSRHNRFTVFDQLILNMLYDPRITPGMSPSEAEKVLPSIVRQVRRRIQP
jgi:hypothetical protein